MPNIEITPEQADALARGEDITIEAPRNRYICVMRTGNVFDVLTSQELKNGDQLFTIYSNDIRLIARGPHSGKLGRLDQRSVAGQGVITKINARGRDKDYS
jgi:hypothetical protein